MKFHLRRTKAWAAGFLVLALSVAIGADPVPSVALKSRKGVAYLHGFRNGQSKDGTGFLVDDRTIITNAHVVQGANAIVAEFDNGEKIDCSLIDLNPRADLAALSLERPVRDCALPRRKGDPLAQGDQVILVGSPIGLKWSVHTGRIAAIRTMGEIAEQLGEPAPADPNQRALQLDITSAQGMSGAPVLSMDGDVVGIQRAGWGKGATTINFCIPQESVDLLDLKKRPTAFRGGVDFGDDLRTVGLQTQSLVPPTLRVDDRDVNVGCTHWGFVPSDVNFVFNQYVGDKVRFGWTMPQMVVQGILARHRVVHVTNAAFGLSFLVPENYELTETAQKSPLGMRITLTNRDTGLPPERRKIVIHAWRFPAPNDARAVDAKIREISETYARKEFGLQIHPPFSNFNDNPTDRDVEQIQNLTDPQVRFHPQLALARFHSTYGSHSKFNKSWNIYAAVTRGIAVVTAYEYQTRSMLPGLAPDSAERQFIAETVSYNIVD